MKNFYRFFRFEIKFGIFLKQNYGSLLISQYSKQRGIIIIQKSVPKLQRSDSESHTLFSDLTAALNRILTLTREIQLAGNSKGNETSIFSCYTKGIMQEITAFKSLENLRDRIFKKGKHQFDNSYVIGKQRI